MPLLEKYQLQSQSIGLLIELHYLPSIDYISGLMQFEHVQIEAEEHYQKQSYRNRCYVLTANKVDALAVPVQQGTHHQPIRNLRVDNGQPWQQQHWRCLRAAYGKAPFFDYYAPELEPVYQKKWTFLFDINYELLTICLKQLRVKVPFSLTNCYEKEVETGVFDARSRLNPRQRTESYVFHQSVAYQQNFGVDFVPNLSIIDLIFCQGPAALDVLKAGFRNEQIL
ncbi:WbqC family protein [Spirosoma daeguense]